MTIILIVYASRATIRHFAGLMSRSLRILSLVIVTFYTLIHIVHLPALIFSKRWLLFSIIYDLDTLKLIINWLLMHIWAVPSFNDCRLGIDIFDFNLVISLDLCLLHWKNWLIGNLSHDSILMLVIIVIWNLKSWTALLATTAVVTAPWRPRLKICFHSHYILVL